MEELLRSQQTECDHHDWVSKEGQNERPLRDRSPEPWERFDRSEALRQRQAGRQKDSKDSSDGTARFGGGRQGRYGMVRRFEPAPKVVLFHSISWLKGPPHRCFSF